MKLFLYKIFKRIFRNCLKVLLNDIDYYDLNQTLELKTMLQRSFVYASSNHVEGDYFEFGLYKGRSFMFALKEAEKRNMHCYGFDSFEGLPELHPEFDDNKGANGKQKWETGQFKHSQAELRKTLNKHYSESSYSLTEGFFDESLTPELLKTLPKAAIVHVDSDLYESAIQVLNFMKPLLQDGTVLIFDDYYCFRGNKNKGEARALTEFLAANEDIEVTHWFNHHCFGASFILIVK